MRHSIWCRLYLLRYKWRRFNVNAPSRSHAAPSCIYPSVMLSAVSVNVRLSSFITRTLFLKSVVKFNDFPTFSVVQPFFLFVYFLLYYTNSPSNCLYFSCFWNEMLWGFIHKRINITWRCTNFFRKNDPLLCSYWNNN